ncbi:U3 snoRNP protein [Mycoemilia scoparia]|uniref:U3 snoRNP protein n=1 Tax=Mycoemilia scoparia TaxID=417184 RepID=A0A9W7ZW07_9FUNG|nr:U3 snoRNP protein [Mycoemilia scoparia]
MAVNSVKRKRSQAQALNSKKDKKAAFSKVPVESDKVETKNIEDSSDDSSSDSSDDGFEPGYDEDADQMQIETADVADEIKEQRSKLEAFDDLYRPPTAEEMMVLSETSHLYRSNLFRLQMDELLNETKIDRSSKGFKSLDMALKKIRQTLMNSNPIKSQPINAAIESLEKKAKHILGNKTSFTVPVPGVTPPSGALYSVHYEPPKEVNVIGSYALGMAARMRGGFNVDLSVQIPEAGMFQDKDHLNYRYFHKRAYYLAALQLILLESDLGNMFEITRGHLNSDYRLPILYIRPKSINNTLKGEKCPKELDFSTTGATIRILPTITTTTLPIRKLSPERNHIRYNFIESQFLKKSEEGHSSEADTIPTPKYNAALLTDCMMLTHTSYLHATAEKCPSFIDAALLIKIWWRQRGYGKYLTNDQSSKGRDSGSINGFVLTMMLAWVINGYVPNRNAPRLSTGMSAYQLFKGFLAFLSQHDFSKSPLSFHNLSNDPDAFSMESFVSNYEGVLVDPTGKLNILAGASDWELKHLRLEGRKGNDYLDDSSQDRFEAIFLQPIDTPATNSDHLIKLELLSEYSFDDVIQEPSKKSEREIINAIDCGNYGRAVLNKLVSILNTGLDKRVELIIPYCVGTASNQSNLDDNDADANSVQVLSTFMLSIFVNPEHALRLVDLGPQPDVEKEESKKHEFLWGDKSDLRRFRDGSIRLATVWGHGKNSAEQRSEIIPRMVAYLLRYHFGIQASPEILTSEEVEFADKGPGKKSPLSSDSLGTSLSSISTQINGFVASSYDPSPDFALSATDPSGLPTPDTFESAIRALNQLSQEMASLDDELPLRVLTLHSVAPGLRYASVQPPKPLPAEITDGTTSHPDDSYTEPLTVLVEFERSSKWPDNLVPMQKLKSAFLHRLGQLYTRKYTNSTFTPVSKLFGHGINSGSDIGAPGTSGNWKDFGYDEPDVFIDLYHGNSGLTFRLVLKNDSEVYFLNKKVQAYKAQDEKAKAEAVHAALTRWRRTYEWRPDHHRRIHALCQRFHPGASLSIRLFKRWLASHMLLGTKDGVPEEVAELMVASVFTDPAPYIAIPSTGYSGFVRVLERLSSWAWKEEPLVVDFAASEENQDKDDDLSSSAENSKTKRLVGMLPEARNAIQKAFSDAKAKGKVNGGWFISTEFDPSSERWGIGSPVITKRLKTLCKASLSCLNTLFETGTQAHISQMFITPLDHYDFLIRIDPSMCCRRYEQPPAWAFGIEESTNDAADKSNNERYEKFKNLLPLVRQQITSKRQNPNPFGHPGMVGFDPISLYVRDLRALYHDVALFFYDQLGGSTIGGIWIPSAKNHQVALKAHLGINTKPIADEKETKSKKSSKDPEQLPNAVHLNIDAVLNEILTLGDGLVDDIELK